MMHKNRKKTVYLFSSSPVKFSAQAKLRSKRTNERTVSLFLAVLYLLALISLIIPLRPSYSELEQRNLTKFPKPTLATIGSGEFFEDMNTWFADTFPFREQFLKLETSIAHLYGVQSATVVGDVGKADEIPDAPMEDDGTPESDVGDSNSSADSSNANQPAEQKQPPEEDAAIPEMAKDAKSETFGAVLVVDDAAYEYFSFDQKVANHYIKMINSAAKKLNGKAKVYDLVIPTSMDVCVPDSVRSGLNTSSQEKAIEYLYGSMSPNVTTVKVLDSLIKHNADGEYVYFRTDHHWTALGAYYAYERFCQASGQTVKPLEQFEKVEYGNFQGSFYRDTQSAALGKNPDSVIAYIPPSTNTITITNPDGTVWDWYVVSDVTTWNSTAKYSTFIGGDNPFSVIKNPKKNDGSAVLLIKESFGNAYAPFLVENYQNTYILDYRYFKNVDKRTLLQLVDKYNINDVLFLNNVSAIRNESAVKLMDDLVG